ncbi:MAG: hypothetical protein JNM09_31460, partial [Blastocatellia bacterium]|nr:hypothetical protein [Blastocatellia bacterium]
GEEIVHAGWVFHVAEADERRVLKVRATRENSAGTSDSNSELTQPGSHAD